MSVIEITDVEKSGPPGRRLTLRGLVRSKSGGTVSDHLACWKAEVSVIPASQSPQIFVSYRRADSGESVGDLCERLREDLGARAVFRDADSLIGGQRWQDALDDAIVGSDVSYFLVGPEWPGDAENGRRIDQPDDPVRREVQVALDAETTPVPVLLGGLTSPPSDLPPEVARLFEHHAVVAADERVDPQSPTYQHLLVAAWEAIRRKVPNGVLVLRDDAASIDLAELVAELKETKLVDASKLSQLAAGVWVAPGRRLKKFAKKLPDVVIFNDDQPSAAFAARVSAALENPRLAKVAMIGSALAVLGAATTTVIASGSALSVHSSATGLAATNASAATNWAGSTTSAWTAASLGAKAAVGAALVVVGAGAVIASWSSDAEATVRYGYLDVTMASAEVVDAPREGLVVDPESLGDDEKLVVVDVDVHNTDDSIEWRVDTDQVFHIEADGELYHVASRTRSELPPLRTVDFALEYVVPSSVDLDGARLVVQEYPRDADRRTRPAYLGFDGSASDSLDEVELTNITPSRLDVTGCEDPDAFDIELASVLVGDEAGYRPGGGPVWNDSVHWYFDRLARPREGKQFVTVIGDAIRFHPNCAKIGGISFHLPVLMDSGDVPRDPVAWHGTRLSGWSLEPSPWISTFEVDEDLDTFRFLVPSFDLEFEASIAAG